MTAVPTEIPLPALAPYAEPTQLHGLRLLPAPDSEPPYDDELPGGRPLPLRPRTLPAPTCAAVARSWPRWWSANRGVIGSDPNLIHPGTRLVPPTEPSAR